MKPKRDQAAASRWILYHGTSSYRLDQILRANRLNPSQIGPETRQISLTPERSVAEYFACNAVLGDEHDHPHVETEPVVLVLDGEGLIALMYDLEGYSGDGEECDWENEIACWSAIDPLDEVLIDIQSVPDDRTELYFELPSYEQRRDAYRPLGSRLAEYELRSVIRMVNRLEEGQVNEDKADQVAAAISRRRLLVRSGAEWNARLASRLRWR
jgi:hypothetical protein